MKLFGLLRGSYYFCFLSIINLLCLIIFLPINVAFAEPSFCQNPILETLPILADGRVKPFLVHTEERIKFLTGKTKFEDKKSVELYCLLSFSAFGLKEIPEIKVRVDHDQARNILGLNENENSLAFSQLVSLRLEITKHIRPNGVQDSLQKELQKILGKISLYQNITSAQDWTIPVDNQEKINWTPLSEALQEDNITVLAQSHQDPFAAFFEQSKMNYIKLSGDHYLVELRFHKMHLFTWSLSLVFLSLFALAISQKKWVGISFTAVTWLVQIVGVALRIIISGRAPVTNMYETVMFSGLGALSLSLILAIVRKEKIYVTIGLCYNLLCLLMMNFASGMLSPSISPLVPVLRDNFWLSTHVTCVILSYSALALSWILANLILIKKRFFKLSAKDYTYYSALTYTAIKCGVVLLAAGIILGGVWADYSWGRFWGWDPKETWSLIVLLLYMAILHGRYTSWISPKRFIPLVAVAFLSVLMAWFGVNYILASGLHSYGFSEGGAIFLITLFALQFMMLILTRTSKNLKNI